MKTVLATCAVLVSTSYLVRANEPAKQPVQPPVQSKQEDKPWILFGAKNTKVRDLFPLIAKNMKVQILVADNVQGTVNTNFLCKDIDELMQSVCSVAKLSYGKVGNGTFLVVPFALAQSVHSTVHDVTTTKEHAITLAQPVPQKEPETRRARQWQPFDFNGQTYYIVPGSTEKK